MNMQHLICIVCPKGCHLQVDENNNYEVKGNACLRGEEYGRIELTNPTRTITSTVQVSNGKHRRCPVKTDKPIPKNMIHDAMELLDEIVLNAPVYSGQEVVQDILGTGINFVATRDIE
jgi:CxxC motif-containing protein